MSVLVVKILAPLICLAIVAGGVALARNFRGIASWHARLTVDWTPFWSANVDDDERYEQRVRFQTGVDRFIGAVFALAGFIALIVITVHVLPSAHARPGQGHPPRDPRPRRWLRPSAAR